MCQLAKVELLEISTCNHGPGFGENNLTFRKFVLPEKNNLPSGYRHQGWDIQAAAFYLVCVGGLGPADRHEAPDSSW